MDNQELNLCACCASNYDSAAIFCNTCGFPLKGTKQEQDDYIANRAIKEIDLVDLNSKVDRACSSLYWIAGLITLSGIFTLFMVKDDDELFILSITFAILIAAFLALAVWSKTKPAAALISGLSLYLIVQVLGAVQNPATLFSGIIFKIFIIAYLIKGIISVLEVEKIKKELNIK